MANSDPARRPPYRRRPLSPDEHFRESLAQPVPNRTYRSQVDLTDTPSSPVEQVVRLAASLLGLLLLLRFITNLLAINRTAGWTNYINSVTNWIVQPFQSLLPQPTITSGGIFDWPTVAAFMAILVVAAILVRLLQPHSKY